MQSKMTKMIGNVTSNLSGVGNYLNSSADKSSDLDSKIFGKSDFSAFTDWFKSLESESIDSFIPSNTSNTSTTSSNTSHTNTSTNTNTNTNTNVISLKDIQFEVFDWNVIGSSPSLNKIIEVVEGIVSKSDNVLTFIPPDINFTMQSLEISLRYPLLKASSKRKLFLNIIMSDFNISLNISQAPNTNTTSSTTSFTTSTLEHPNENQIQSLQGIVSLIGCLIQMRVTIGQLQVNSYLYKEFLKLYYSFDVNKTVSLVSLLHETHIDAEDDDEADEERNASPSHEDTDLQENWNSLLTTYKPMIYESNDSSQVTNNKSIDELEEQVILFQSKSSERFFILCLLVDFNIKGDGAADIQVSY